MQNTSVYLYSKPTRSEVLQSAQYFWLQFWFKLPRPCQDSSFAVTSGVIQLELNNTRLRALTVRAFGLSQRAAGGWRELEVVCEDNQFKHNQKLRGIKATAMR